MKKCWLVCAVALCTFQLPPLVAQNEPAPAPATLMAAAPNVTAYTLPPDRYKKAHALGHIRFRLTLFGVGYGLVVLWLILRWRLAARYRDWAERSSARRFLQSLV